MHKQNPFGNPDGARADLKEIENSFITDYPYGNAIKYDESSILNKRFIVGAKGSGKTVYLRKIQSLLKAQEQKSKSIYVDDSIEQNLPCTDKVITFCELYDRSTLTEKWNKVWQMAILLTLADKFLYNERLKNYITEKDSNTLKRILLSTKVLDNEDIALNRHYSLYSYFELVLFHTVTKNNMDSILENRSRFNLFETLKDILKRSPEIYLFADSIDLEYEHAPLHWLMCQKGLFYAVSTYLQDDVLGGKLHLIITLRDNVFYSILGSEHSSKFMSESHVFHLKWDDDNIRSFLSQKIQNLSTCYFLQPIDSNNSKNIYNWLSIKDINDENGDKEEITSFIIRHTRLVPRDIIIICNELAKLHAMITANNTIEIKEWIRNVVLVHSKSFGTELLTICAKNVTANGLPADAGRRGYTEGFTVDDGYHKYAYTRVENILKGTVTAKYFSKSALIKINEQGKEQLGFDPHLLDILWQNGVIGYYQDAKLTFIGRESTPDLNLPLDKAAYVLCACVAMTLFDKIDGKNIYPDPDPTDDQENHTAQKDSSELREKDDKQQEEADKTVRNNLSSFIALNLGMLKKYQENLVEARIADMEKESLNRKSFIAKLKKCKIILITANKVEDKIITQMLFEANKEKPLIKYVIDDRRIQIGCINKINIAHVAQQNMGSRESENTVKSITNYCMPRLVVSIGVAYGINPKDNSLGDVLISQRIIDVDHNNKRVDGAYHIPYENIIESSKHIKASWEHYFEIPSYMENFDWYYGSILSKGTVLSDAKEKEALLKAALAINIKDVIGGEMEGAGIFRACLDHFKDCPCVIIKGICDWGEKKNALGSIIKEKKIILGIEDEDKLKDEQKNDKMKDWIQAHAAKNAFLAFKKLLDLAPSIIDLD